MSARVHSESARRISDCVTALLREQPFFGSLALRLPIRADASRETVASDGRDIRYSPRWIADAQAHVIKTAMARVVLACALKHHTRRGERDPERWQCASQLVTHGLLKDAGFTLPPDAEAWDGISVEQAYDRLPAPDPDDGDGDSNAPSGGGAAGADSAGTPPSPDSGGDDDSRGSDDGAGDDDPQDGDSQDTNPDANASPSCDPAGTGEVMDAPAGGGDGEAGPSPANIAAEEQAWDEAMHQAASLAKAQGKLPRAVEETRAADIQAQSTPPRQATPLLSTRPLQTPISSTQHVDLAPLTRIPASALRAHPAPQCLSATAVSPMPPPVPCMPRPHCGVDHVLTCPIFAEFLESKSPRKYHCFQGVVLVSGVGFEPFIGTLLTRATDYRTYRACRLVFASLMPRRYSG